YALPTIPFRPTHLTEARGTFFPSPLVGEGAFPQGRRMRGLYPRRQTPHPSRMSSRSFDPPKSELSLLSLPQGERGREAQTMTTLPEIPLPSSIRSRYVDGINGLRMHVLEAGF